MNEPHKDISKQLEYVKQQQQLRAFGTISSSSKTLSADTMIEKLLSKKETFLKRPLENQIKQEPVGGGLIPPLYEKVWLGVQTSAGLADTPLLSTLLMSSGLTTETLGYLWALVNHTVPGALTQNELYTLLAMVALAQTGYIVSSLVTLSQFSQIPVPVLDCTLLPRAAGPPPIFPTPLNVTTLTEQLSSNWSIPAAPNTGYSTSSDKIGISYVSNTPMLSPDLLSDQVKSESTNPVNLSIQEDITEQNKVFSSNLPVNKIFEPKPHVHIKHSANTFSFPILNESPSHVSNAKPEEQDSFDDEFADFQSADISSVSDVKTIEDKTPRRIVEKEDEFLNFQTAFSHYNNDDLSVLVVGGKNIPSAQQLWVTDSPLCFQKENIVSEGGNISKGMDPTVQDKQDIKSSNTEGINTKYDLFQEVEDDKCGVFHNPLSEDEDIQSVTSGSTIENVHSEPKSIFKHFLFENPESSLGIFNTNHEKPCVEPQNRTLVTDSSWKETQVDNVDDEFCNFQNFPCSFSAASNKNETESAAEHIDKYDVFRTIEISDSSINETQASLNTDDSLKNIPQLSSYEPNITFVHDGNFRGKNEDGNSFSSVLKTQCEDDMSFGDYQQPFSFPPPKIEYNIENTFSSMNISEDNDEIKISSEDNSSVVDHSAEDKYKALRFLEEADETDEFGEFLGAELPNEGNEPPTSVEQMSIQVRCLEACLNLLKAGVATLSQASSQEVVAEILSDPRANNYLDCLLEVHRVSERIISNLTSECCTPIITELRKTWKDLSPYFAHSEHNHMGETIGAVCGVCRSNTGPSPVMFGPLSFHTPCANLYLHCVEPILPNTLVTTVQ